MSYIVSIWGLAKTWIHTTTTTPHFWSSTGSDMTSQQSGNKTKTTTRYKVRMNEFRASAKAKRSGVKMLKLATKITKSRLEKNNFKSPVDTQRRKKSVLYQSIWTTVKTKMTKSKNIDRTLIRTCQNVMSRICVSFTPRVFSLILEINPRWWSQSSDNNS